MNNKKSAESLLGLIGKEALKDLLKRITDAMELPFCVIDYRGNFLIESMLGSPNCKNHGKATDGCGDYQIAAAYASAKAAIQSKPCTFVCPHGYTSIAVPIIVNEQYAGAVVGGQMLCDDPEGDAKERRLEAIGELIFSLLQEMIEKEELKIKLKSQIREQIHIRDLRQKNERLSRLLSEYEEEALREKVLPHFLLDLFISASHLAILENADQTEEFMEEVSSILRYYVEESPSEISMETELSKMETYLKILKKQYGDRMNYKITIRESCKQQNVPHLGIFPFLNYIVNLGFLPENEKDTLLIDVDDIGDHIFITISLNNKEISIEQLPNQEHYERQVENAVQRIKKMYGEQCTISVQPDLVILDLPKLEKDA